MARLSGAQGLGLCYGQSTAEFSADGYCTWWIALRTTATVTTGYINVASDKVRGWDFTARYVRDIGPGEFRANAVVSHYLEQSGRTFPSDPYKDFSGMIGAPEYTGQLDLTYDIRNWKVRYGLEWVGSINGYEYYERYDNVDYRPDYLMEIDDYFLSNLSVQYKGDDWSVTGGVRNLADKNPPIISTGAYTAVGNAPLYSGYDYIGRVFFFNFSKKF